VVKVQTKSELGNCTFRSGPLSVVACLS